MKEINLEEIIKNHCYITQDGQKDVHSSITSVIEAIKDACKQVLELAAENIEFIETTPEEWNSKEYEPFITADDGTIWTFDKQSILDIINQVK